MLCEILQGMLYVVGCVHQIGGSSGLILRYPCHTPLSCNKEEGNLQESIAHFLSLFLFSALYAKGLL